MLFELFNQVGPVASIRICRDSITRRSLGYGYVNFHNVVDAERALDTLNYQPIKGKPCRLMWSQRDPAARRNGSGNIFIKNLDKSIDNKALHDTFSAFGNILSCKVVCDENGSKGFGFVHYETSEAAEQAIEKVNGMLLNDVKVFVGRHIPRRERESKSEEIKAKFTNVYVKNLDESVNQEEFEKMFYVFGEVTSSYIAVDETGKSKGFAFVNYKDHESAQKAVDELNNKDVKGKPLFVGRAQMKQEREEELRRQFEQLKLERISKYQGVNVFIKNLDISVDEDKLREEFGQFGQISSCKVMRDDKQISRGFGFICFSNSEEATKAVTEMNGKMLADKPIYAALAQRKEERKAQLEAQYMQRAQMRMQSALGAAPMYPGAPMYYPTAGVRPGMIYPPQMMARPRWMPPNGQPRPVAAGAMLPQQMPYAMMPMAQRGRPSNKPIRGGMTGRSGPSNAAGGAPRRGGFKFAGNPRGRPDVMSQSGITTAALASMPPEQQKSVLGERLFPLVQSHEGELAGKITGMLLEMDNAELLHLLESPEALAAKVEEAVAVLRHHLAQTEGAQWQEGSAEIVA